MEIMHRNNGSIGRCLLLIIVFGLMFLCGPADYSRIVYIKTGVTEIAAILFTTIIISMTGIGVRYRKLKIDFIILLLLFRLILLSFGLIINYTDDNLASYFSSVFAFMMYTCASNMEFKEDELKKFVYSINIILFIQVLVVVISQSLSGISLDALKVNIQVPVGGSNYIAAFVIMILPFLWYIGNGSRIRIIMFALAIMTILLTRTTSGVGALIAYTVFVMIHDRRKNPLKILLGLFGAAIAVYLIYRISPAYFDRLLSRSAGVFSGNSEQRYLAFNGRIALYQDAMRLALTKPLFGVGFGYRQSIIGGLMAHNWILEIILTGGFVGLTIYIAILFNTLSKLRFYSHNGVKYARIMIISVIGVLAQGLFEPSLGTFRFDTVFWLMIGIIMSISSAYVNTSSQNGG